MKRISLAAAIRNLGNERGRKRSVRRSGLARGGLGAGSGAAFLAVAMISLTAEGQVPHQYRGDFKGDFPGYAEWTSAQRSYWEEWSVMRSSTDKLLRGVGATNTEVANLLRQVQTNAAFLDARWNAWFDAHARQEPYAPMDPYLEGLRANNWELGRLKKEKDAEQVLAGVRDVAWDMQIKADNCRNSSDGLGKVVRVKVHTRAEGKEVGGYEVFYVSKGMFDVKSAHDRFPRQSSPTDERELAPGGYTLWARKDHFSSTPVSLGIGGRGELQVEVDLEVPAGAGP